MWMQKKKKLLEHKNWAQDLLPNVAAISISNFKVLQLPIFNYLTSTPPTTTTDESCYLLFNDLKIDNFSETSDNILHLFISLSFFTAIISTGSQNHPVGKMGIPLYR